MVERRPLVILTPDIWEYAKRKDRVELYSGDTLKVYYRGVRVFALSPIRKVVFGALCSKVLFGLGQSMVVKRLSK